MSDDADHGFAIAPLTPAQSDEAIALIATRLPALIRTEVGLPFQCPGLFETRTLHGATDLHGRLMGVGMLTRPSFVPVHRGGLRAVVARKHEGRGVGTALRSALLPLVPQPMTRLGCTVFDDDERSLAVARHWGLSMEEHSVESSLDLTDPGALPDPVLPAGVTIHEAPDLMFADHDAVAHMLRASQTNPEAAAGLLMTLEGFVTMLYDGEQPVCVLARVGGVPAGITFGGVAAQTLSIAYSGVDPRFRGHGLMRAVKQRAHQVAARLGGTVSRTNNEEHNSGIRRINADLGYVVQFGVYRMVQDRPAA